MEGQVDDILSTCWEFPWNVFRVDYLQEFKREAIKLVTEQHLNVAAAGQQLDVTPKSIRSWIAESERGELKATLGAAKLAADQQRIRALERELAIAREERDILKKATAYFAKLTK